MYTEKRGCILNKKDYQLQSMDMTEMENKNRTVNTYLKRAELTDKILAAFYTVYNGLAYGFLEKVYQNALRFEME